jgi:mannose/fructose-specific phosphotransferase system component IIA
MTSLISSNQFPKLIFVAILGLLSLEGCLSSGSTTADRTIMAFPGSGPAPAQTSTTLTLDTPVERIAADPGGAAVLNKDIPGLLSDPNYPIFKGMNLKMLASLSSGRLDGRTLAETQADLAALPKQASLN